MRVPWTILGAALLSLLPGAALGQPSRRRSLPVGLLLRDGDEVTATVVRYALWSRLKAEDGRGAAFDVEVVTEFADLDDPVQVDRAVCRLLQRGVVALLASVRSSSYPVMVTYSNDLHLPLLSPDLPDAPPPDLPSAYGLAVRPSTTRALLETLRHLQWKDVVYIYDDAYGAEKLQYLFLLGYRLLGLRLAGLLRTRSAAEAGDFLRRLNAAHRGRQLRVVLDTAPALAKEIVVRHVHDVRVRKDNFHFFLKQPTLEEFWQTAALGALNVTGFLAIPPQWPALRNFRDEWAWLNPGLWAGAGAPLQNMSTFFFYDAAVLLADALRKRGERHGALFDGPPRPRDCRTQPPSPLVEGSALAGTLKASHLAESLTGALRFDTAGRREDFVLSIVEPSGGGYRKVGAWSDRRGVSTERPPEALPTPAALLDLLKPTVIRVTTKISPPYMMLRREEEGANGSSSSLAGNDRFEGFCKDLMDRLAAELRFDYRLQLVKDGLYGSYSDRDSRWSGMVGEIIEGEADIAMADLAVTASRQRVLSFTDPFQMVSFGLLLKRPGATPASASPAFFLAAFAPGAWVCLLAAAAGSCALFYALALYTGEPDSLESATGMWGRRFSAAGSVWFFAGSGLFQGTGIYPRSVSSRLLGAAWWLLTLAASCLYVASLAAQLRVESVDEGPQLARLRALSLESVVKESVASGWPKVGLIRYSNTAAFIKKSSLPTYAGLVSSLRTHPEASADSLAEGLRRVRASGGGYALMVESQVAEYESRRRPCDTVAVHDGTYFAGYGIATPLGSPYASLLKSTLMRIQTSGLLGHLHRKWWIDTDQCKRPNEMSASDKGGTLHSVSGLFYVLLAGLLVLAFVSAGQYFWKSKRNEEMRRRLSFEDMNIGNTSSLPAPPPELLEPPDVEEQPRVADVWAERGRPPTSFGTEMRPAALG